VGKQNVEVLIKKLRIFIRIMDRSNIPFLSGVELAEAIRNKKITSCAVLEIFIERVELLNPKLNAVVIKDYDRARARAKAADVAIARGELWGPIHGVPFTVKENNDVSGLHTTIGNLKLKDFVADKHEVMIQRVVAAGGIIFGKTNLPLDAMDLQSYNIIYGSTSNPWDLTRTPGGSSGGAAAALAAYLTPFELGGDIGGSIRGPASFTGIYGHKPTYGLIPKRGPSMSRIPTEISVRGPLARTIEDLKLLMSITAGADEANVGRRGWKLDLPQPTKTSLKEYKVAIWADDEMAPVCDELTETSEDIARFLENRGCVVDRHARPQFSKVENQQLWVLLTAANRALNPGSKNNTSLRQYRMAREKQQEIIDAWEEFFNDFDILICPSHSSQCFVKDESENMVTRKLAINKNNSKIVIPYFQPLFWAFLTNIGNLPSTTFPCGIKNGLPVCLNAVSKVYYDNITMDFVRLLKLEGGLKYAFTPPPAYSKTGASKI
jgi:amidase